MVRTPRDQLPTPQSETYYIVDSADLQYFPPGPAFMWDHEAGGVTLPSAFSLTDPVQYFAPGPEFTLVTEPALGELNGFEWGALDTLAR